MDNISTVDTTAPSVELLSNPSFEDSTTSIPSWVTWCSSHCQFGTSGQIVSGGGCYLGTGNCFVSSCLGGGIEFLGHYFLLHLALFITYHLWFHSQDQLVIIILCYMLTYSDHCKPV
ncbi:unnamed protein product [Rotaria magnacalcarata]|uniref:Uncharacterized protein n=1 Tax=Rotaria magnacalcarata TaxID=392030 RepID=A0A820G044_9BILA|nr:unnamed protein product [Rotaria magnacalcarata]CAF4270616.1 unnamed protein product [Rotaria magnacalcarata]